MEISAKDINNTRKEFSVTVPVSDVQEILDLVLKAFNKQAKVPGFRPGKVPAPMLKKRFEKEIAEELKHRVISKAYRFLEESPEHSIFALVTVDAPSLSEDAPAVVTLTVDVKPSFELPEYKGLNVSVTKSAVSDEEIQKAIENIRNQRAEYNKVEDRPTKSGDYVHISYKGTIDGQPIEDVIGKDTLYGSREHAWEEVGASDASRFKEIADALEGMKIGDEKEVTVNFPNDFKEEALQGKSANYSFKVAEIREKVLPELDDKFLKSIEVDSLEQLQDNIKQEFSAQRENQAKADVIKSILEQLSEKIHIEVPESAVEQETLHLLRRYMNAMLSQGIPESVLREREEEIVHNAEHAAKAQAKANFILEAIAKNESIDVENQDIQQVLMREAYATRTRPEELIKQLKNDNSRRMEIRMRALCDKVLDFLCKEAKVEYKEEA